MNMQTNKIASPAQSINDLKQKSLRLGVLGGSFDPAHKGHLGISKYMLDMFELDYVLWAVALQNPTKNATHFSFEQRIQQSTQLTQNEPQILVTNLEANIADDKVRPVYTYEVIEYLQAILPQSSLHFIMGADNLCHFHKWKNWHIITQNAQILVYDRLPHSVDALSSQAIQKLGYSTPDKDKAAKLVFCSSKLYDASSTNLRQNRQ